MAKQILKVAVVLILVALIWKLVIEDDEPAPSEDVDRIAAIDGVESTQTYIAMD